MFRFGGRAFFRIAPVALGLTLFATATARGADIAIPEQPADPVQLLAVQRSAALLSGGTSEHRRPFRFIIYGQSISQQWWAWDFMREMSPAFRNAEVRGQLQAIGSFQADYLIQTAEADIYPFLPDLIIFHCYGAYGPGQAWEQILRNFRTRTTADIILIGNHLVADWELNEPTNSFDIRYESNPATNVLAWVNYVRLPALSRELGLCNPDNRSAWKQYLRNNQLKTADLLRDGLHLNKRGSDLLKAILMPYLHAPRLSPPVDPMNNARVQTIPVGSETLKWNAGRLRLPFVGNRVDLIAGEGKGGPCRILIDGRSPSTWPSGTGHTRSSSWAGESYQRPAVLRVAHEVPLVPETWTLTITEMDPRARRRFSFSVEGSVTGPDGNGVSTQPFVSNSRRVVIQTNNWNFLIIPTNSQVGTRIVWKAQMQSVDRYEPLPLKPPTVETAAYLIFDLPDEPHVVELLADDPAHPPPIRALRIYHPAGGMPGTEVVAPPSTDFRWLRSDRSLLMAWPAARLGWLPPFARTPGTARTADLVPSEMFGFRLWVTPSDEFDTELLRSVGPP